MNGSASGARASGMRGGAGHGPFRTAPSRWAFRLAVLLLVAAAAFILTVFDRYGISNDEEVQHVYGRLLLDFYASGLDDRRAFEYKNLYLYGGLFDLIAAALERLLHLDPAGARVWELRHLLSAMFGLSGLAACWMLARQLGGELAGVVALVLLLVTGTWTGAMFTHTKDVPFAATMAWAAFFTVRVCRALPSPPMAGVVGLGLALGCAFGLRVGAVFAVGYLGITVLALSVQERRGSVPARLAFLRKSAVSLLPVALIAALLAALFWPWAVMSAGNLVKAITAFSHFSFQLDTILDGRVMANGEVPAHYLVSYLLVRLPELFLLGLAFAAWVGLRTLPALFRADGRETSCHGLPVILAALLPLGYTLLAAPPLYNGIRHFIFLLPPLAALAGVGLVKAWQSAVRWPRARIAGLAGSLLLLAVHAGTLVRLHPYEYVAYNSLAGGLRGAAERWEQDYWATSLREAAGQLNTLVAREGATGRVYTVAVCAEPFQVAVWLDPGLIVTRDWRAADFFLSPTHMDCDGALKGQVVGKVERDGVPLAVVLDRRMLTGEARRSR
ncbi:hypothetical protein [Thauera aromatica]|uniref:hypothetical protein n=1 Tax=Thauera aromatica TaxID=59405 RepID=UPI0026CB5316